jgi:hypothetical protein
LDYLIEARNIINEIFIGSLLGASDSLPVIPATQEPENRRIAVGSQPRQIVRETLPRKKPITKKGW